MSIICSTCLAIHAVLWFKCCVMLRLNTIDLHALETMRVWSEVSKLDYISGLTKQHKVLVFSSDLFF